MPQALHTGTLLALLVLPLVARGVLARSHVDEALPVALHPHLTFPPPLS